MRTPSSTDRSVNLKDGQYLYKKPPIFKLINMLVLEQIKHPKFETQQDIVQQYSDPIILNYSSNHLSYRRKEVTLQKALDLLDAMSSKEEFYDSWGSFYIQDELGTIQFLNFDHKTWFFDIPIYDDDWTNEALNCNISRAQLFKIVIEFFSRGSLFQYIMSKNYIAIIQLVKELWDLNIDANHITDYIL